jgi:polyhydroxybutyrate depolymerase
MRNYPVIPLTLAALALALSGCSAAATRRAFNQRVTSHTFTYDGLDRTYLLLGPETAADHPLALVLALHGGGGTARSICAMPGGLAGPAQREGYLLVCPEGVERHWNDGRGIDSWRAHADDIDDVGFLVALIEQLASQYSIAPGQIFATGISNGGQMSYRLACEQSGILQAIAPVAASMAVDLDCAPDAPVSVLVINGTQDPLVPYTGGEIRAIGRGLGWVRPTAEVLQFWATHNGCDLQASSTHLPDEDPEDDTRIRQAIYPSCNTGTRVELYEVIGGGHTWPGANQYLPAFLIGRLSRDVEASDVIFDFFSNLLGQAGL